MKVKLMELPAIGPKMMKMVLKDSLMLWKMFSGSMMTLNTHGTKGDSKDAALAKAREKEKEKVKEKEKEDVVSSSPEKAKEREKVDLTW